VRTFVLHDGADSKETDKLHKFLDGIEWEGDEGGVDIRLHVNVGDTIVIDQRGAILIRRR
jgi:hypothetical protein